MTDIQKHSTINKTANKALFSVLHCYSNFLHLKNDALVPKNLVFFKATARESEVVRMVIWTIKFHVPSPIHLDKVTSF